MADLKISQLSPLSVIAGTEIFPIAVSGNNFSVAMSLIGVLANAQTWTGTQHFNPPIGTLNQGITSSLTLPSSGTSTSFFGGSLFTVTNPGWYVDNGNGVNLDAWGLSPMDAGVRVNYSAKGGVGYTIHTGLAVAAINSGVSNQLVGLLSAATGQVDTGGVDTLWGIIGSGIVGASANISAIHSIEAELFVHPSATLSQRTAFSAVAGGAGTGSLIDAVLYVYQSGPVATGYGNGASFGDLILLDNGGPNPALATTASIITSRGGSSTIASLISLPNYTFTVDIINVPNLHITAAGIGTITGPSGANIFGATTASGGAAALAASANGTTGFDGLQATDVSGNNALFAGVFEASNTGTFYGQTAGNWAAINAHASTNAGLMVGTLVAKPLILGTNNTSWLNLSSAGLFNYTGTQQYSIAQTLVSATGLNWRNVYMAPATTTIVGNIGSPITKLNAFALGQQTLTGSSAVTVTDAATMYIDNAPAAGGTLTITNAWSLFVNAGNAKFGGHVSLEGVLSTGATGTGNIVFSASPTLSAPTLGVATATSISFGQTTLSNYTEGSWTPTVTTTGTVGTPAYSAQVGSYERIGRVVICRFFLTLSGWTGSPTGNVQIAGLPYVAAAVAYDYGVCNLQNWVLSSLPASTTIVGGFVGPATQVITITAIGGAAGNLANISAANAGTTPTFFGSVIYHV